MHARRVVYRTILLGIISSGVYDSTLSAVHRCVSLSSLSQLSFHQSPRTWAWQSEVKTLLTKTQLFTRAFLKHVRAHSVLSSAKLYTTTQSPRRCKSSAVVVPCHPAPRLHQLFLSQLRPQRSVCILRMRLRLHCSQHWRVPMCGSESANLYEWRC